jgi:hypothetical protein
VRGVPARRRGSCTEEHRHDPQPQGQDPPVPAADRDSLRRGSRQAGEREQHNRQVHELLTEATHAIRDTDPGDIASALHRAWTGVCLIGAATEILSVCADADDYRPRRLLAQQPLTEAVSTLRATPALRGAASAVNPAGSPDDRLTEPAAAVVRDTLVACCDALQQMMSRVPSDVRPQSAARACAAVAGSSRRISDIYQAPGAPKPAGQAAADRPRYLDAVTPGELQAAASDHLQDLAAVDPRDTPAALVSAWYGFSLVSVLGQYLALRDTDAAVLHENALPVLARIVETMEAAPLLPSGVHGLGLETSPAADPTMITIARRGIWHVTLANALLPEAGCHARYEADQLAAETCTALAAELADCYRGRLRTFLNPHGRQPGSGSTVLQGA